MNSPLLSAVYAYFEASRESKPRIQRPQMTRIVIVNYEFTKFYWIVLRKKMIRFYNRHLSNKLLAIKTYLRRNFNRRPFSPLQSFQLWSLKHQLKFNKCIEKVFLTHKKHKKCKTFYYNWQVRIVYLGFIIWVNFEQFQLWIKYS